MFLRTVESPLSDKEYVLLGVGSRNIVEAFLFYNSHDDHLSGPKLGTEVWKVGFCDVD